ncbi:MAG: hypothetical protein IJ658_01365, partial [Kiritimatiellae bacterium]|nr:hypothetical protein [Kiritimatiellia bacterium]
TYEGLVRWGFGFHNPNHAAAAICAVLPFVWGFGRAGARPSPWVSVARWLLTGGLLAALALTYSRTGFVVAALEALGWGILNRRGRQPVQETNVQAARYACRLFVLATLAMLVVAVVAGGAAGRFVPDAAALNRPKIWWAGLKLAAANPWGVGYGHSGLLASTFLLDGIEVRTLVNSHLTLLAEYGWIAGCAWFAFVAMALFGSYGRAGARPSLWTAFAGLSVSAWMSSVFDWHVLFGGAETDGTNFALSWLLFAAYLAMGARLVLADRRARRFAAIACVLPAALPLVPAADAPRVRKGFVVKEGAEVPLVFHDEAWQLKAVLPYLEDGYRLAIEPGFHPPDEPPKSVWLFGTCAESAHRFANAAVTVVSPPEFCVLPQDVIVVQ